MTTEDEIVVIMEKTLEIMDKISALSNPTNQQLGEAMQRLTAYSVRLRSMRLTANKQAADKAKELAVGINDFVATLKYRVKINIDDSFNNR